ncbi:hypothetical protein ACVWYD_002721 [Morganella morganii]
MSDHLTCYMTSGISDLCIALRVIKTMDETEAFSQFDNIQFEKKPKKAYITPISKYGRKKKLIKSEIDGFELGQVTRIDLINETILFYEKTEDRYTTMKFSEIKPKMIHGQKIIR